MALSWMHRPRHRAPGWIDLCHCTQGAGQNPSHSHQETMCHTRIHMRIHTHTRCTTPLRTHCCCVWHFLRGHGPVLRTESLGMTTPHARKPHMNEHATQRGTSHGAAHAAWVHVAAPTLISGSSAPRLTSRGVMQQLHVHAPCRQLHVSMHRSTSRE